MTGGGSRTGCGSEWSRCCLRGRRIRWAFTQLVAGLTALGRSPRTLPGDCRDQSVNLRGEHDLGLVAIGRSAAQSDCGGTCRSRRTLVSPRARSAPLASAPTRIRQRPEYHHAPVVVCANALGSGASTAIRRAGADAPAQGLVRSSSHTRPIHLSPAETRPIATGESERSGVPLRKFA
jgi:hypothetical protein